MNWCWRSSYPGTFQWAPPASARAAREASARNTLRAIFIVSSSWFLDAAPIWGTPQNYPGEAIRWTSGRMVLQRLHEIRPCFHRSHMPGIMAP